MIMRGERIKEMMFILTTFLLSANLLFYAFFQIDINRNVIRIICVIACAIILWTSKTIRKIDFLFFIVALYLIIVNGNNSINLAFMLILSITMKVRHKSGVLQNCNIINAIIVAVVIISLSMGLVKNINWTYLGRTRNTFGFLHVNYVGILSFSVISLFLLSKKNIKWYEYIISLLLSFFVYRLSDSRTGFFALVIMIMLSILLKYVPIKIATPTVTFIIMLIFLSPLLWKSKLFEILDINLLLSQRPQIYANYIAQNGIKELILGGSKIPDVDSSLLLILYNGGVFVYAATFFLTLSSTLNKLSKNEYTEVAFILAILSIANMESSLLRPEILCMAYYWMILLLDVDFAANRITVSRHIHIRFGS